MYTTQLGKYCSSHLNWEQELSSAPYNLKISHDGDYVMFKYNQIDSDFNLSIVRESRGIIFKNGSWEYPVCRAFDKFGNYGESYADTIEWESASVTEKIDGSLIKMWYDDGRWHISTNGTIDAFKAELNNAVAKSFGDLFIKYFEDNNFSYDDFIKCLDLNRFRTYMFEMVSPYNRVVIPYDSLQLYYLGSRDHGWFRDKIVPFYDDGQPFLRLFNIKTPRVFPLHSLSDCINAATQLSWDEEGYVVDDQNGNRVKIKSPSYVMAHYARTTKQITTTRLIEIILSNECEEFLVYASEYTDALNNVMDDINMFNDNLTTAGKFAREKILNNEFPSRKDFAEWVFTKPKYMQPFLFKNYSEDFIVSEYTNNWSASKWEENIDLMKKEESNE